MTLSDLAPKINSFFPQNCFSYFSSSNICHPSHLKSCHCWVTAGCWTGTSGVPPPHHGAASCQKGAIVIREGCWRIGDEGPQENGSDQRIGNTSGTTWSGRSGCNAGTSSSGSSSCRPKGVGCLDCNGQAAGKASEHSSKGNTFRQLVQIQHRDEALATRNYLR